VYTFRPFTDLLRLVVIHRLPWQPHNAVFHLFSAEREAAEYGARHYRPYSPETSTLLYKLFNIYQMEGLPMPLTLEELRRETEKEILANTPPEKLLERIPPEKRLEGIPPEKRLEGIPPEKLLVGLSAEDVLSALKAVTPEVRARLVQRLREDQPPASPQ
jgi:hypothetical protein